MALFVGEGHQAAVDELVSAFDAVVAGDGPRVVCLESETGLGKTRVVHEFYARLARERQGPVPYWPSSIGGVDDRQVLEARKLVNPAWSGVPGTAAMPWFWWGMECQLTQSGSSMAALQSARSQFERHVGSIQRQIDSRQANRELARDSLVAVASVVGAVVPGVALAQDVVTQGAGLFARWRARRGAQVPAADTVVGGDDYQQSMATQLAKSLAGIAAPEMPVVLFVDDAHWADPALVNMLRQVQATSASAVLIVATAWTHALRRQAASDDFTTFGWFLGTIAGQAGVQKHVLDRLSDDDLGRLVYEFAPNTSQQIVDGLVDVADGNPLVLRLILGLDAVRRDAEDGSIDAEPAALKKLPRDVGTIFGELFRQLPDDTKRLLALLAVQGEEFDTAFIEDVARDLRMTGVVKALRDEDAYGWIQPIGGEVAAFTERARYDIASEQSFEVFSEEELDRVRRRIADQILTRRSTPEWRTTPIQTRRLLLSQFDDPEVGMNVDPLTRAEISCELSELALQAGDVGRGEAHARTALRILDEAGHADTAAAVRARRFLALALAESNNVSEALDELGVAVEASERLDSSAEFDVMEDFHELVNAAEDLDLIGEDGDAPNREGPLELAEYPEWTPRPIPELTSLDPSEISPLLAEIVDIEGPVVADRAYQLLRAASGASRLGRQIKHALDRGVNSALRRGLISAASWESDSLRRVLDRPNPKPVVPRVLGSRDLEQVPLEEIIALLQALQAADPTLEGESLKRSILRAYEWSRLTQRADAYLTQAIRVAERPTARRTIDEVAAKAAEFGLADEFAAWADLINELGWDLHAWPASITATPRSQRTPALLHLAPQPSGQLKIRLELDAIQTIEGLNSAATAEIGSGEWTEMPPEASAELRARLRKALPHP